MQAPPLRSSRARALIASLAAVASLACAAIGCSKSSSDDGVTQPKGDSKHSRKSGDDDLDDPSSTKPKRRGKDDEAKGACTPGKQEACACPGGAQGVQVCNDEGSRFGKCECPKAEPAPAEPEEAEPAPEPPPAKTAKPAPKTHPDCVGGVSETPCALADRRHGWCKNGQCVDLCGPGKTYVSLDAACHKPCTASCSSCQEGGCLD